MPSSFATLNVVGAAWFDRRDVERGRVEGGVAGRLGDAGGVGAEPSGLVHEEPQYHLALDAAGVERRGVLHRGWGIHHDRGVVAAPRQGLIGQGDGVGVGAVAGGNPEGRDGCTRRCI